MGFVRVPETEDEPETPRFADLEIRPGRVVLETPAESEAGERGDFETPIRPRRGRGQQQQDSGREIPAPSREMSASFHKRGHYHMEFVGTK
jgi:hypothetical protein